MGEVFQWTRQTKGSSAISFVGLRQNNLPSPTVCPAKYRFIAMSDETETSCDL
jgi:hypothetical protein